MSGKTFPSKFAEVPEAYVAAVVGIDFLYMQAQKLIVQAIH